MESPEKRSSISRRAFLKGLTSISMAGTSGEVLAETPDLDKVPIGELTLEPFEATNFFRLNPEESRDRAGNSEIVKDPSAFMQDLTSVNFRVNSIPSDNNPAKREPPGSITWKLWPKKAICTDYAVTKRHELLAKGWPSSWLSLAEVVTSSEDLHMVLVVRVPLPDSKDPSIRVERDFVLDSNVGKVLLWSKYERLLVHPDAIPTGREERIQMSEDSHLWRQIARKSRGFSHYQAK